MGSLRFSEGELFGMWERLDLKPSFTTSSEEFLNDYISYGYCNVRCVWHESHSYRMQTIWWRAESSERAGTPLPLSTVLTKISK
jgi:hypothetical protein